ncbi:SurA N-terminal domain-containing protein [Thalassotalea piscium]|uniref:Periplasmic chaperone PpiD n=1 Tax=Thalassotalea piscium TaxID=1230533 RepID=A0A7X0NH63_9GAMM|nr:SurA N-terminal domain-containing protein [Thalassotalea piscium]MBB6543387.1 peptidyl-prolyl cis-trans isomerase D [Thalassotalea piscium]
MLENIREKSQGVTAKVILGLVILTFAFAGIGSYTNSVDTSVAQVNDMKITQSDFDKAYQNQRNRMAQQFGEMFDTLSADANYMANFRSSVLENLINEKLIDFATAELAIRVSDERIKQTIREMPEFQVDGKFDNNRYLALINQAGFYQTSDFRDYLRVEMTRRQLNQALIASEFSLPYEEAQLTGLQNQKRDIRFAQISAEQFKASVEVTEQDINDYYQNNQNRFQNQEKVKVNYIALSVDDIADKVEVTAADLEQYYQQNIAKYQQNEQKRFSHILIEIGDDEAAAKAQITDILTKANSGEDFAVLAEEFSADTFSGENGGDLEWIEPGVMDDAFDEAAFALSSVGSISDVVQTDFGFHIIKLTELKPEQIKDFAEVKDEIQQLVSTQKAEDKFFELQQEMARLSFEFPDSLEDAAGAVGGKVQTSDWLTRFGNTAPFDNAKVLDAAFSDIVVKERLNSDIIEVNDSLALVLRTNEYQAANTKPLAEVSEQIKTMLIAEKATEKAQNIAQELLTAFKAGEDVTAQLAAVNASFEVKNDIARFGAELDNNIAKEAFKLPHPVEGTLSASTVTMNNGDLALLEVSAVKEGEPATNSNFAQQHSQQLAQATYKSFIDALRDQAKITRREVVQSSEQF